MLFLFCVSLFAQNEVEAETDEVYHSNIKLSKASKDLLQKILYEGDVFQKYKSKNQSVATIKADRLIISSNDVILFGKEVEYRKLLFTGIYYGFEGQLKEVRHFFYGDYSKLRLEYFSQRETMKSKYGAPISTNKKGGQIETTWYHQNKKLVLKFGKERVSSEGAIFASITKLTDNEMANNLKFKFTPVPKSNPIPEPILTPEPIVSSPVKYKVLKAQLASRNSLPKTETVEKEKPQLTIASKNNQLFTVSRSTSLRSEGLDGSPVLGRVRTDDTILILDTSSTEYWAKVRFDDMEGWVKKSVIQRVKEK
jgi:hypothetical protein